MAKISESEYIAKDAGLCPACGSKDTSWGKPTVCLREVLQEGNCNGCKSKWLSRYSLMGYEMIREENNALSC